MHFNKCDMKMEGGFLFYYRGVRRFGFKLLSKLLKAEHDAAKENSRLRLPCGEIKFEGRRYR